MADRPLTALLTYHCLTGPLIRNPTTEIDKTVNKLRLKYRTYSIDYEVDCGAVMMPHSFGSDFGDQINREAVLVDKNHNEFDVCVERVNGNVYFTKGWGALRDFYDITFGAWITVVFLGLGRFQIKKIKCRVNRPINLPTFVPPVRFNIDRTAVPTPVHGVFPASIYDLAFRLQPSMFAMSCSKHLTEYDVKSGFLELDCKGFAEVTLEKTSHLLAVIDDCGNRWECIVVYEDVPDKDKQFVIGGEWKRMVDARKFQQGDYLKIGAPAPAKNPILYFSRERV